MRRLLRIGAFLSTLLVIVGCTARKEPAFTVEFDFEQPNAWISPPAALPTAEQAHTGTYSFRLAAGTEYGPSYSTALQVAGPNAPRELHLSGWAYLPNGRIRSTMLVVSIDCQGRRPNVWEALRLDQTVKRYQVWVPIQKHIRLPADLLPTDKLSLYVWHNEPHGESLFLDDLKLECWQ